MADTSPGHGEPPNKWRVCRLLLAAVVCVALLGFRAPGVAWAAKLLPRQNVAALVRESGHRQGPDEVPALPGYLGNLHVRMRAGYITVHSAQQRRLWYTLIDAEPDAWQRAHGQQQRQVPEQQQERQQHAGSAAAQPLHDDTQPPVVLWLTGGPGCSSLDAFIYEHGPFKFAYRSGGDGDPEQIVLQPNPWSWTKAATMLYVDSPAGTGFSYSGCPDEDYHTNDQRTIADLVTFIKGIWRRYPELSGRKLYIAGESYGGVYVPRLAEALLDLLHDDGNHDATGDPINDNRDDGISEDGGERTHGGIRDLNELRHHEHHRAQRGQGLVEDGTSSDNVDAFHMKPNFKLEGYLVGNAVTEDSIDGNAEFKFAYDMGYIGPDVWQAVLDVCDGGASFWNASESSDCYRLLRQVKGKLRNLNRYSVLEPCYRDPVEHSLAGESTSSSTQQLNISSTAEPTEDDLMYWPYAVRFRSRNVSHGGTSSSAGLDVGRARPRLKHVVPCGDRRIALQWLNAPATRAALKVDAQPDGSDDSGDGDDNDDSQKPADDSSQQRQRAKCGSQGSGGQGSSQAGGSTGSSGGSGARVPQPVGPPGHWEPCSDVLDYDVVPQSLSRLHLKLLGRGLRALVYSGDHDMVVPHTGSREWVWRLGLQQRSALLPWEMEGQVAGFKAEFEGGLTYATVKGGGHMVPSTSPQAALHLLCDFLYVSGSSDMR